MRLVTYLPCRSYVRRSRLSMIMVISIINFTMGLFLITSILTIVEKYGGNSEDGENVPDEVYPMYQKNRPVSPISLRGRSMTSENALLSSSDYYFRFDYTLDPGPCKPAELFKSSRTMSSIEQITNEKFKSMLGTNVTFAIDALRVHPNLKQSRKIKSNSESRNTRSICDYVIQLDVVFYYTLSCDTLCRSMEVQRLVSATKLIADQIDLSWNFQLYLTQAQDSTIDYYVKQLFIHRISKYHDRSVFIHSVFEDRFISALVADSEGSQTSVIMSQREKALFNIQTGLDASRSEQDPLSIYLSFSSVDTPNAFLRHYTGRIRLSKNDQTDLFKKDATFKLIESPHESNAYSFESTNMPELFISVDPETKAALILTHLRSTEVGNFNETFLFRFMIQF